MSVVDFDNESLTCIHTHAHAQAVKDFSLGYLSPRSIERYPTPDITRERKWDTSRYASPVITVARKKNYRK